jgi:hypothetical protein
MGWFHITCRVSNFYPLLCTTLSTCSWIPKFKVLYIWHFFVVYTHTQVGWSCSGKSLWWLNTLEISFTQYEDWSFYFFLLIIKFLPKRIITWFASSTKSSKGIKKKSAWNHMCSTLDSHITLMETFEQ